VRSKEAIRQLIWLVFLGCLFFGQAGGLMATCCPGVGAVGCEQVHEQASGSPCPPVAAAAGGCCTPCYGHHPGQEVERAPLLPQLPTFRSVAGLVFLVPPALPWDLREAGLTGFGRSLPAPQQNPALTALRSTVLLL